MNITDKHRNRLITLLKELFQLDQPELDFGLYKIMHAKSVQITKFLETDLLKEIELAFGEKDSVDASQMKAQAIARLKESLGDEALDDKGNLQDAFRKLPAGKKYLEEMAAAEAAKDTLNAESEIYDHLYRFFERYYDKGDFMSRRYYARESDSRAAPYSIPYDGREVYLHWANKDQYYIKSSEYLTNYTFELNEAIRLEADRQKGLKGKGQGFDFDAAISSTPLKVHCRIVDASEGEHSNIKATSDQKRFFIIHVDEPISVENGELVIQFQYRTDSEKTGQDNTWQQARLQQAEAAILETLKALGKADQSTAAFMLGLQLPAPTDSKDKRTLLGKYLQKYAARNTMDYFIHKDLGGFMRRELDFYIKNEIMRLDDIENAEAPKVEQYLSRIRVLRRIAHQLIAFLAQLEDFQKKLWLKKKFVTETNYCITLDRVPESFYAEIVANDRQREEWVKLFAIDEIKQDLVNSAYSVPLTVKLLKANPYLMIDTALFDECFKQKLLAEIPDLDTQCDGVLIHSENFQALELMQEKYREQVKCIHIDPPYNTQSSEFLYKNSYQHASWLSMMKDRFQASSSLMKKDSVFMCHIDEHERENLHLLLEASETINAGTLVWDKGAPVTGSFGLATQHEYVLCRSKLPVSLKAEKKNIEIMQSQAMRIIKSHGGVSSSAISEWRKWLRENDALSQAEKIYDFLDDSGGIYRTADMTATDKRDDPKYHIPLIHPLTNLPCPVPGYGWRYTPDTIKKYLDDDMIIFGSDHTKIPRRKVLLLENKGSQMPSIYRSGMRGKTELDSIGIAFPFAHSTSLYQYLISGIELNTNDHVLDYFGGSGTTAHSVIKMVRDKQIALRFILVEMGEHFDQVIIPRLKKAVYSKDWQDGKPVSREGISHCFKYLRLESYEDALNNLVLKADASRDAALEKNPVMQRDYLLNYFLDVETSGSQSLLNIADFRDPTAYQMQIKKPGSEEQTLQNIDLIETFNWLIGLWVRHMGAPHSFSAEFEREKDADLPKDQNTRLLCKRLKPDASGAYWFRLIEGYTLKVPGDDTSKVPTLIVWRKQTDDAEKDNAVLQKFLMDKLQISPREQTYGAIYINGSHTLPNPVVEGEQTKVRLIEEAFHTAMWAGVSV